MKINATIWDTDENITRHEKGGLLYGAFPNKVTYKKGEKNFKIENIGLHIDKNWNDFALVDNFLSKKDVFDNVISRKGKSLEEVIIIEGHFDEITRMALKTQFEEAKEKRDLSIVKSIDNTVNRKKNSKQEMRNEVINNVMTFLEKWVNDEIKKNSVRSLELDFINTDSSGNDEIIRKIKYSSVLIIAYAEDSNKEFQANETTKEMDNEEKIFCKATFRVVKNTQDQN